MSRARQNSGKWSFSVKLPPTREARFLASLSLFCLSSALFSCTSPTAQQPVQLQLQLAGQAPSSLSLADGTALDFSSAQLAFGPLTLCPGRQSGALCETARMEWLDSAVVDLLDPNPTSVGSIDGFTGTVRSYMYDLGYVSLLTTEQPLKLSAATQLDDTSLLARGEVSTEANQPIPFVISVVAKQSGEIDRGQPMVRSSTNADFEHEVTLQDESLTARFSLEELLVDLEASDFFQDASCTDTGTICRGQLAEDCTSGVTEDCTDSDQVCQPNVGCRDVVTIDGTTRGGRAVLQRLVAGAGPRFSWN